jgi:hypothetical protein
MARSTKVMAGCAFALFCLLATTQPDKMPSLMLVVPFILLFVVLWLGTAKMLQYAGISGNRSMHAAMLGAGLAVLLLVLQSLGQLTMRDTLTTFALFAIGYFYLSRAAARKPT